MISIEIGSFLSDLTVRLYPCVSLNNEKFCHEISEHTVK